MKKTTIIAVVALLAVAILFGMGFWQWKSQQNQKVSRSDQAQSQEQQKQQSQQIPEDQLVWYEIPELGIKMKLKKDLAEDLIYNIESSNDSQGRLAWYSNFTMKSLQMVDPVYCTSENRAIGTIVKISNLTIESQVGESSFLPDEKSGLLKRLGDYSIAYIGPHAMCYGISKKNEGDPLANDGIKSLMNAIVTVELLR